MTTNTPKPQYKRVNPATLRRRRQQREEGFDFVLHATTDEDGNPTVVRAKRADIFDFDNLEKMPGILREKVFGLIEDVEGQEGASIEEKAASLENLGLAELAGKLGGVGALADAYCVSGFIEPRCYATAEEADANDGIWVKDIASSDRMAFMHLCTGETGGAAAVAEPFPGRPDGAVDAGPVMPAVPGSGDAEPGHRAGDAVEAVGLFA